MKRTLPAVIRLIPAARVTAILALLCAAADAGVRLPGIFGDEMVLQRDKPVRVWGRAGGGEPVSVSFAGQEKTATGGEDGAWTLDLDPMPASSEPRTMTVRGRDSEVSCENVLVGDVWILGGQSNMEFAIEKVDHGDVEIVSANFPHIRLMTIPWNASPLPVADFESVNEFNTWSNSREAKGAWFACSPDTVKEFSAIGYIFGRRLHLAAQVPVGLIDASRGGTTVEAWTSREMLETIPEAAPLLKYWDDRIAAFDTAKDLRDQIERWGKTAERLRKEGREPKPKPGKPGPGPEVDQNNPGASYNGMIVPFAGLSVKGAIFNQGYNNALSDARPALYSKVFNAMIRDWRRTFRDSEMPFGIVALTAGGGPQTLENFEERMIDAAPWIREGQLKAYQELSGVGFACAYDQQVDWYHPFKKVQLGERLARWALATQYGLAIAWQPALCTSVDKAEKRLVLTFDRNVRSHDGRPIEGFAIAGEDQRFFPARASHVVTGKDSRGRDQVDRKRLEVMSDLVPEPVAVRYAWARNPLGNLVNADGPERVLPVPSFRSDNWDRSDAPIAASGSPEENAHRKWLTAQRKQAEESTRQRKIAEAEAILREAREAGESLTPEKR